MLPPPDGQVPAPSRERWIRAVFVAAVAWKGLYGLFELAAGLALLFLGTTSRILEALTRKELAEDPLDPVARFVHANAPPLLAHARGFAGPYLLGYGALKLFLLYGLLRDRAWVYRASIQLLTLFLLYQGYRVFRYHSGLLAVLTVLDLGFLWMLRHEYRIRSARLTG